MSHLTYYAYPGLGDMQQERYRYSQAVRVGDRIECAGQGANWILFIRKALTKYPGGWNPKTGVIESHGDINKEIDQAFANVELALKDAGGKGWSQVFRVNSYHVFINDEIVLAAMVRNFKKYMPEHLPIWTCVGVTRLGMDTMNVEIEVVAHDG